MKACHPEDAPASLAAWCVAAEERRQLDIQIRLRRWDGAWRWHLASFRCWTRTARSPNGLELLPIFTSRNRSSFLLQRRVKQIVDAINEIIIEVTREGNWSFLNPAWTAHTGFSVEETLGEPVNEWLHPDDRLDYSARLGEIVSKSQFFKRSELRFRTTSGAYRWMEAVTLPAFDEEG